MEYSKTVIADVAVAHVRLAASRTTATVSMIHNARFWNVFSEKPFSKAYFDIPEVFFQKRVFGIDGMWLFAYIGPIAQNIANIATHNTRL